MNVGARPCGRYKRAVDRLPKSSRLSNLVVLPKSGSGLVADALNCPHFDSRVRLTKIYVSLNSPACSCVFRNTAGVGAAPDIRHNLGAAKLRTQWIAPGRESFIFRNS